MISTGKHYHIVMAGGGSVSPITPSKSKAIRHAARSLDLSIKDIEEMLEGGSLYMTASHHESRITAGQVIPSQSRYA